MRYLIATSNDKLLLTSNDPSIEYKCMRSTKIYSMH